MKMRTGTEWNYSYYPVIFENEAQLLNVQEALNKADIFPRRYFYPSLNTLNYLDHVSMEISESISKRILCLPLFVGISKEKSEKICKIILEYLT